jgi:hypothetical protein
MKYNINLILFIFFTTQLTQASKIIIQYEIGMEKNKDIAIAIFETKYNIPRSLIMEKKGNCFGQKEDAKFLHLCINKKGELTQLSSHINLKIKSLLSFKSLI